MVTTGAQSAVVQAFMPLCVAKAEQQPEQLALLKAAQRWQRHDFVVRAGWVSNVSERYRREVAEACATTIVEAMDLAARRG